ncbi:MAG: DUF2155 domain-containing protein [Alphaproteobacteria bacterium]
MLNMCFAQSTNLQSEKFKPIAILQGLDKVTARTERLQASIKQKIYFGTLTIKVRTCYKNPPTENPESAVFVEITDNVIGQGNGLVFNGWMFSSSPALSALEHPIYDVWVVDCIKLSSSSNVSSD